MATLYGTPWNGKLGRTEAPLRFALWVPKESQLRLHQVAPDVSPSGIVRLRSALTWLAEAGLPQGLWAKPLELGTNGVLPVYVFRRHTRAARKLFDAAADRFGLLWFDPERDETTLGLRFGDTHGVTEVLDAVARGGEGWLLLETADGRGPFVEVGLDGLAERAHTAVPAERELGVGLGRAERAQLRLLGWDASEHHGYEADLELKSAEERQRAAEVLTRTLHAVYGVAPGEPMALRFRAEDPGFDAA